MNHLAVSAAAFALLIAPALAADMPMDMSGLNPQPLPPVAEEEALVLEEPMEAVDARVEIINGTDVPLAELYSSGAGSENWQTNLLDGGGIAPGASVTVNFSNAASLCEFDLRAIFVDGTDQVIRGLNACSVGELTFTL